MFGVDIVGATFAALFEAAVVMVRIIIGVATAISVAHTKSVVDEVNKPISHIQPTQPSEGSTPLGEQLPTEWK